MSSDTIKSKYEILYRDLAGNEIGLIGNIVKLIRKTSNDISARSFGRVPFTQRGIFVLDEPYLYLGYPIAFPMDKNEQKRSIDALIRDKLVKKEDIPDIQAFKYYVVVGFYEKNLRYLGFSLSACPMCMYHGVTLENVRGTKAEQRMAEDVHSRAIKWAEDKIKGKSLAPRLLNAINSYMSSLQSNQYSIKDFISPEK